MADKAAAKLMRRTADRFYAADGTAWVWTRKGWRLIRRREMPAKSEAQRRLMAAAAHKKGGVGGVPQKVGREFMKEDPGGKLPRKAKGKKR